MFRSTIMVSLRPEAFRYQPRAHSAHVSVCDGEQLVEQHSVSSLGALLARTVPKGMLTTPVVSLWTSTSADGLTRSSCPRLRNTPGTCAAVLISHLKWDTAS